MTENEAYKLLHPETTAKAIAEIEYFAGFQGHKAAIKAIEEACIVACNAIEELQEYKSLGSVEELREAKENFRFTHEIYIPEHQKIFERIEEALGFKLFAWQKSYLETGYYRKYGQTTAECLKALLFNNTPIDYSRRPASMREDFHRHQLLKIMQKLHAAGIATNPVFRSQKEKEEYCQMLSRGEIIKKEPQPIENPGLWKA